jgi:acetyl-CoA synthetase
MSVELRAHLVEKIGDLARPDRMYYVSQLPYAHRGELIRPLLRYIAEGRVPGGIAALRDPEICARYEVKLR